jgi:lipase chaperone LimK
MAGALLLALAGWIGSSSIARSTATAVPASSSTAAVTARTPAERAPLVAAAIDPLPPAPAPRSLRGTEVDGALERDADGRFFATPRALQLFDYFLTTEGEQDAAAIRAQVLAVARQHLPAEEAQRALALYDQYIDYRATLRAALERAPPGGGPHAALALAEATQVERFGASVAARLFAADNALAEVTVERAELAARDDLDAAERAVRLQALEERLPESMRRARAQREWSSTAGSGALTRSVGN